MIKIENILNGKFKYNIEEDTVSVDQIVNRYPNFDNEITPDMYDDIRKFIYDTIIDKIFIVIDHIGDMYHYLRLFYECDENDTEYAYSLFEDAMIANTYASGYIIRDKNSVFNYYVDIDKLNEEIKNVYGEEVYMPIIDALKDDKIADKITEKLKRIEKINP